MPTLEIFTNADQSKLTPQLASKATEVVASALGKPKSYVCVSLISSVMCFGGDPSPCAQVHLSSIGQIDPAKNQKTSAALADLLSKELGIDDGRMYIFFNDLKASNVGYQRTTFAAM